MARILSGRRKSDTSGAVAQLLAAGGDAARGDTLEHAVERFVARSIESLCQVEKAVPEGRRSCTMLQRIAEARARIAMLEDLLAAKRAAGECGAPAPAGDAAPSGRAPSGGIQGPGNSPISNIDVYVTPFISKRLKSLDRK